MVRTMAALTLLAGCTSGGDDAADESDRAPRDPTLAGVTRMMSTPRAVHRATVLEDGTVLFTGGCTLPGCGGFERARASEIYDPPTSRFRSGPSMTAPRAGHSATLLADGRVLLIGGYPGEGLPAVSSAEVFDPAEGSFRSVGRLSVGRADHTASLLPDGRVLVAGGTDGAGEVLASTEIFDPGTDRFAPGRPLSGARAAHVAVVTDGGLLLIGGTSDLDVAVDTTDVLRRDGWSPGPVLQQARVKHGAAVLPDGTVLVVGGASSSEGRDRLASTELVTLDPARSRPGPALSEPQYKLDGAVTTLADGRVVIAGGRRVDVFDPGTGEMSVLDGAPVPRRSFLSVSAVAASTVLVAGGYDSDISPTADARLVRIT